MATATMDDCGKLVGDPVLLSATIKAMDSCMTMCGTKAQCVGVSRVPTRDPGNVTGMIGVHGDVSGFITVNLTEHVALAMVGGLLQDNIESLSAQVIDGVGEITNLVSGVLKKHLAGTQWGFSNVTIPSVIVGHNYEIAHVRGLQYLCTTFEQDHPDAIMLTDRLLNVTISLIKL